MMGITERKERDRKEMRQLILEAAKTLFLSEGFENVSIRRIAELVEYSPATVYLYFKDKDEILYEMHKEGSRTVHTRFEQLLSIADPLERLRQMAREYVAFAFENPELYNLIFVMYPPENNLDCTDSQGTADPLHEILVRTARECMQAGRLPEGDPLIAAFTLQAIAHGVISLVIRYPRQMYVEMDNRQLVETTFEYFIQAISKP